MSIIGADVGNSMLKDSNFTLLDSKISYVPGILGNKYQLTLENETYYLGEGAIDTEYRKVKKENYIKMLFGLLAIGSGQQPKQRIQLVAGLPISQYKKDKEELIKLIQENFYMKGSLNGCSKEILIEDIEVYPEGISAVPKDYEGIIVDIGGRTTDCAYTTLRDGKRKVDNPYSMAKGTLNLYSSFIKTINREFGLDLNMDQAEDILTKGLKVDNKEVNVNFAAMVFKEYVEELVRNLNVEYSLRSSDIFFTGGGSLLLQKPLMKRIPGADISPGAIYDNAKGFYEVGCKLWQ